MSNLFKKLKTGLTEMDDFLAGSKKDVRISTREPTQVKRKKKPQLPEENKPKLPSY